MFPSVGAFSEVADSGANAQNKPGKRANANRATHLPEAIMQANNEDGFSSIAQRFTILAPADWHTFEMPVDLLENVIDAHTRVERNPYPPHNQCRITDVPAMQADVERIMSEFYSSFDDDYLEGMDVPIHIREMAAAV